MTVGTFSPNSNSNKSPQKSSFVLYGKLFGTAIKKITFFFGFPKVILLIIPLQFSYGETSRSNIPLLGCNYGPGLIYCIMHAYINAPIGSTLFFLISPIFKTLPRSSAFVNWISVRFYETDRISICICIFIRIKVKIRYLYFFMVEKTIYSMAWLDFLSF